jgi:hypothetical protein
VGANFWTSFYADLMADARSGGIVRPCFIDDYLARNSPRGEVRVRPAAWNTGWHHGRDFMQWTGSQAQKDALASVATISAALHRLRADAAEAGQQAVWDAVNEATWRLLRAESSCNFFWGEDWVDRCYADLNQSEQWIAEARRRLRP